MTYQLTRIKNNQITDSTILANTKIVPGSIVGSLFNSNLTMTSDVTITGNLTVQGASTYLTVASTNTYVNDPLIILNNAFSGVNTYDIGLLFNRGSSTATAFIWDEDNLEFQLIYTTDDGTTYGSINNSGYGNLHVGNLTVDTASSFGSIALTGDITVANVSLTGDLLIGGGDLTANTSSFNLLSTTVTTANVLDSATTINLGSTTGNLNLNNANIWMPNATSVDSGAASIDLFATPSTANLLVSATTLNFANNATLIELGSTSGTANLRNATTNILGNATVGGTLGVTGETTLASALVSDLTSGRVVLAGASGALEDSANLTFDGSSLTVAGNVNVLTDLNVTGGSYVADLTATGNITVTNTLGVTGNITGGNLSTSGHTSTGTLLVTGDVEAQANIDITGQLTVGGSVSAQDINGTVIGNVTPADATFTTLTAQSNVSLGLTEAAAINNTPIGNAVPSTGKFTNIYDTALTETRIPFVGAANVLTDSANLTYDAGILTVQNFSINGATAEISVIGGTGNVTLNPDVGGVIDATGSTIANVADPINQQDAVTLNYLNQQLSSAVTNLISDDTDITVTDDGMNPGVITANVDATSVLVADANSLELYGNAVIIDAGTSNVVINTTTLFVTSNTEYTANVEISSTTASANYTSGALTVAGGVGIAGDLNTNGEVATSGNVDITATTESDNTTTGAITVAGGVGISANLNVGGNVTVGQDVVVQGNLTVQGTTTTLNTNTLDVEDLNITIAKGAASAAAADGAGITVDGANATITYESDDDSWNLNKLLNGTALALTGNVSAGGTITARDINGTVIGNVTPAEGYFTNLTSTGNTSLGLTEAAAINNTPIGNAVASSAQFTTLEADDVVQFTDTTEATAVGTGALRVTGGASVGGNLYIGGNVNFVGSSYVLTGNSGVFYGDINGFNALYAGVTGYTVLPQTVLQTSADYNGYVQNNFENLNTGNQASTDWVATAGDGSDTDHYIDMGITTVNWNGTQDNSLTNAVGANDGYLYVQGNVATGQGGNLVVGASTPGIKKVSVIVGGNTASSITAVFTNPGTSSTSKTSGALTVDGGVGVTGNLYADNVTVSNVLTATDLTLSGDITVNGGDIITPATANIALDATALTIGATTGTVSLRNPIIELPNAANVYSGMTNLDVFTINTATANLLTNATTLNVGGNTGTLSLHNPTIELPNAAFIYSGMTNLNLFAINTTTANLLTSATTLNVGSTTGTLTVNNPIVGGSQTTANLWNTTATTINFAGDATLLNIGADTGTVNINNDTVNLEGNVNVNKTTASTDATSGALVVDGGVGIGGNLYVSSQARVLDTTASTQYDNGALVVSGGIGVNGNVHVPTTGYIAVGEEISPFGKFPESLAEFYSNANIASAIAIQNLSSDPSASSNFVAVADNNINRSHIFAIGIANSQFDEGTVPKPNDAYAFCEGGNTIISAQTMGKDVVLNAGSPFANTIVARARSTTGSFDIVRTTQATSPTTGALTVAGGAGIGGNIWVANGAVINNSQTADNFTVKGQQTTSLIYADSVYGAVVIGGSNASPQLGATLKVNSTDSFMLPVGATADRPGNSGNVDVAGMIRFNTSSTTLEFYNGTQWTSAGSDTTFTIISNEQFTGNGAANTYVLSRTTTTSGCVVSINGILQIPTLAYTVTGNVLQFTENPASDDLIDVRIFTTTQTVGDVTSPNGLNAFTPDNTNGAAIYSGTTSGNKAIRATAKPDGTWAYVNGTHITYDQTAVNVPTASAPIVVDSFSSSDYSTAKYVVQVKEGSGNVQIMEALVAHDGANAYVTTYGIVDTNGVMGTLSANIVSSNVRLYYTSSSVTNSNVKVYTTYIV
jgi:hypothetical protein